MRPLLGCLLLCLPLVQEVHALEGGPTLGERAQDLHTRIGRMTDVHATAALVDLLERVDARRQKLTEARSDLAALERYLRELASREQSLTAEKAQLETLKWDHRAAVEALVAVVEGLIGHRERLRQVRVEQTAP